MFGLFKRRKEEDDFSLDRETSLKAYISRAERENAYKEAKVVSVTGYAVRGIVIDYSDTGVCMRFQNVEYLSEYVELIIPGLKVHTRARVVWHDRIDYGLEFCEPIRLPA